MLGLVAAIIIVLFALGLGYYLLNNRLSDRKQELADVQQQTQLLQGQVADLRQYQVVATQRAATEKVVQTVYADRTLVSDILESLSLVVPENVWFTSLNLSTMDPGTAASTTGTPGNTLSLVGNTYSFEDVAQLLVRLQLIPALSGIKLASAGPPNGTVDTSKGVKGFSIGATVENTQAADTPLPVSQVEVEGP
jgi:Tfp pilus assembly protein PilN